MYVGKTRCENELSKVVNYGLVAGAMVATAMVVTAIWAHFNSMQWLAIPMFIGSACIGGTTLCVGLIRPCRYLGDSLKAWIKSQSHARRVESAKKIQGKIITQETITGYQDPFEEKLSAMLSAMLSTRYRYPSSAQMSLFSGNGNDEKILAHFEAAIALSPFNANLLRALCECFPFFLMNTKNGEKVLMMALRFANNEAIKILLTNEGSSIYFGQACLVVERVCLQYWCESNGKEGNWIETLVISTVKNEFEESPAEFLASIQRKICNYIEDQEETSGEDYSALKAKINAVQLERS